ncbi:gibberellin 2-beta-dioxygenase 8-like [Pyrus communis]|uniref:gibberellin 2-beta-dioxygenase 8-like n=1 Tax=Pyrus communis TaxID=23211 RepID=UPI0035C02943
MIINKQRPAQQEDDDLHCSEKKMDSESYPPPFRSLPDSTQAVDLDDQVNPVHDSEDPIPLMDLQSLKLGEACEFWGIFRLVNHGVPPTLLTQLREHAKMVFSLPFESKQSLITSPLSYFWGTPALTPSGEALSTKGSSTLQNINWVEGLNVPLAQLGQFQIDNRIIASFSLVLEEYGKHLARLATTIFDAMVINLGLDPLESKSHLSNSTGIVRVYRYPPHCSNPSSASARGMDVHTDSSVLSILNQDEVGGLEVLKDNEWFSVNPIPNTLIVNLGDMMQAISNDKYKSVKHRVKVNRSKERISICHFVFPGEGSVIRSSNYKPFTYRDFQNEVQQDIKSVGYKVGLERFKA